MAKLKGILQLQGTLDGISFYRMKGVDGIIARQSNGLDAKRIRKDPAFQNTRKSNEEFSGAAFMGKAIRKALAPYKKTFMDPFFCPRLTGKLRSIALLGKENPPGKRSIRLSRHPIMLEGLLLNKEMAFNTVCRVHLGFDCPPPRTHLGLQTAPFDPGEWLLIPDGATHFQISLLMVAVSDYIFHPVVGYGPQIPEENGISASDDTAWLPLDAPLKNGFRLSAHLPGMAQLSGSTALLAFTAIRYSIHEAGMVYPLQAHAAMQLAKVFV